MNRFSLIVYVSGAPGSGKTTLAEKIARELYIPHISSDLIHGGIRLTAGQTHDRKKSLINVFIPTLVFLSEQGVSIVVDHVLQKNMSEKDIIEKIMPHATVINVHTIAKNSINRHLLREQNRTDHGVIQTQQELIERSQFHASNLTSTQEPLDLGLPQIVVDTTDGYMPVFAEVIDFIEQNYKREP